MFRSLRPSVNLSAAAYSTLLTLGPNYERGAHFTTYKIGRRTRQLRGQGNNKVQPDWLAFYARLNESAQSGLDRRFAGTGRFLVLSAAIHQSRARKASGSSSWPLEIFFIRLYLSLSLGVVMKIRVIWIECCCTWPAFGWSTLEMAPR